jgi:lipopolysaccharide transport system permease protein
LNLIKRFASLLERHRWELIVNLVVRNLKIKYRGSVFGFLWSLITPLLQMCIYTVVFSLIIRIKVEWPFVIFLLTAQLPWIFFASSLQMGAGSVIEHSNLVKKVYFPREILPLATVLSNLISMAITFVVLLVFVVSYKIPFTPHIILIIPAIIFIFLFTFGLTLMVSCLAVYFRDIFHMLEILILMLFWTVPIVYPLKLLDDIPARFAWFRAFYAYNPLVGFFELFRYAFLYQRWPAATDLLYSLCWSVAMLVFGYLIFKHFEKGFAREI